MDFELTSTQKAWREKARKLADEVLAPRANEVDKLGKYPWDNVQAMAKEGFFGLVVPKEFGGSGESYLSCVVVMEELSRGCAGTATILLPTLMGIETLKRTANDEQKRRFYPSIAGGELQCSYSISERGAGSDAGAMETRAILENGRYTINGHKVYGGNVEAAGIFIVPVKTSPEKGARGISIFAIERGTAGLTVEKIHDKLGLRASVHGDLLIRDCVVPKDNLLGEVDSGFRTVLGTLDVSRTNAGGMSVGIAEAAYRASVNHAKTRVQFGHPLAQNQAIQFMLADMDVEIQAARLLVYQAATGLDRKLEDVSKTSAAGKLYASEMAQRVTGTAMQIHAGFAYDLETSVNRYYRDARSLTLIEGTSEIQRIVIGRSILV